MRRVLRFGVYTSHNVKRCYKTQCCRRAWLCPVCKGVCVVEQGFPEHYEEAGEMYSNVRSYSRKFHQFMTGNPLRPKTQHFYRDPHSDKESQKGHWKEYCHTTLVEITTGLELAQLTKTDVN